MRLQVTAQTTSNHRDNDIIERGAGTQLAHALEFGNGQFIAGITAVGADGSVEDGLRHTALLRTGIAAQASGQLDTLAGNFHPGAQAAE